MRIAFDAKRAFQNNRGLGNYSRDVIRLLMQYAPENEYYLMGIPSDSHPAPSGTHVVSPERWLDRHFPGLWRSGSRCLPQLLQAGVEAYHGLSQELPLHIERTSIRTYVTIHDAIFVRYPELYDPFYVRLFTKKNRRACRVAHRIVCISEQTRRDAIAYFGADERKTCVVYQGCNNRYRVPVSDEQVAAVRQKYNLPKEYIIDVGAIEERKNLDGLLRALHDGSVDMPLVVVGHDSKYAAKMKRLVSELGMQGRVQFLHCVAGEDMPALYKGAILSAYPSHFEGFGIPILEAMCVGTPVLTTRGGCFQETGGEAAMYADSHDVEEMAHCLNSVLGSRQMREQMIRRGFEQSALFADAEVAKNLIRLYE
ncbi:MAG: glycosyltransferase family 4 protein [Paludibacteraceae bacterium]|nr:glycosyltransferase family 4 protein [Paludibacteraceae bacterium]